MIPEKEIKKIIEESKLVPKEQLAEVWKKIQGEDTDLAKYLKILRMPSLIF